MVINACSFTLKPGRFYIAAGAALLCGIKIPCGENCRVFCFQWPGRRVAIPWPFCTFSYTALRAFLMRLCGFSNAGSAGGYNAALPAFPMWLYGLYIVALPALLGGFFCVFF